MSEDNSKPTEQLSTPEPEKPKAETLHMKRFMRGEMTPQEAHQKFAIRKKCALDGKPAVIRIQVFMPLDEFMKRAGEFAGFLMAHAPDGKIPTVPMKGSDGKPTPFVRVSSIGACATCKDMAIKTASKAPSWCIVEVDEGPDPKNKVSVAVA